MTDTLDDLPQPEYEGTVPTDDLHVDGDNPNSMDSERFDLLCDRIQQRGWVGNAIITDTDGLIADGEHRWRAAREIGLSEVPVKQYDLSDADRRLVRQELNKIEGVHDTEQDALEYDRLLSNGLSDPVEELTDATGEDLEGLLNEVTDPSDTEQAVQEAAESSTGTDPDHSIPSPPDDPKSPPDIQKGENNESEAWEDSGMPEYENEDQTPDAELKINFRTEADKIEFGESLETTVTEKTKSVWWPHKEQNDLKDKRYKADDE